MLPIFHDKYGQGLVSSQSSPDIRPNLVLQENNQVTEQIVLPPDQSHTNVSLFVTVRNNDEVSRAFGLVAGAVPGDLVDLMTNPNRASFFGRAADIDQAIVVGGWQGTVHGIAVDPGQERTVEFVLGITKFGLIPPGQTGVDLNVIVVLGDWRVAALEMPFQAVAFLDNAIRLESGLAV